MRLLISAVLAALIVSCAPPDPARAQRTQPTDYPGCIYYSSFSPVLANNQATRIRCDANGQLLIAGTVTATVDTTGLATSTNQGTQIELATSANTKLDTLNTTLGTPFQAGGTAIVVGPAASGAALSGAPVRIGMSDGTNAQNWLAGIALGDGVNGNNTGAVAGFVWNGATWDRMPGSTTGVSVKAASGAFASGSQPIGITPTDRTVTSATGASQTVMSALATRKNVLIMNTGNANCGINPTGGTAVIGGAGTLTLTPGGSGIYSPRIPTLAAITAICTAGQPLYAEES